MEGSIGPFICGVIVMTIGLTVYLGHDEDRNYSADLDRALLSQCEEGEVVTAAILVKESLTPEASSG